MNNLKPRFGPTVEEPASLEYVESCCYPVFVQPIMCPNNKQVIGLDGWCVYPGGNWAEDFQVGGFYADDAVFWSRLMGPGFLKMVLCSLVAKGGTRFGGPRARLPGSYCQIRECRLDELRKELTNGKK